MRVARWVLVIAVGLTAVLLIMAALGSRSPVLRKKLVETLEDKLDADVELQNLHASAFPTLSITGDGLTVRMKRHHEGDPLIDVRHFEVSAGLSGLFYRPRRFHLVRLEGLRITIPPDSDQDEGDKEKSGPATNPGPVIIEYLESKDAELVIVPRKPDKAPRVFAIHDLKMRSVGFDRAMPFDATLTNPLPTGLIQATGSFGPWRAEDPGHTPLNGKYEFTNADLGTIKGIGGILRRLASSSASSIASTSTERRKPPTSASTSAASRSRSTPPSTRSSTARTAIPTCSQWTHSSCRRS